MTFQGKLKDIRKKQKVLKYFNTKIVPAYGTYFWLATIVKLDDAERLEFREFCNLVLAKLDNAEKLITRKIEDGRIFVKNQRGAA